MYKTLFLLTFKTNLTLQNSEAERAALTGEDVAQTKHHGGGACDLKGSFQSGRWSGGVQRVLEVALHGPSLIPTCGVAHVIT